MAPKERSYLSRVRVEPDRFAFGLWAAGRVRRRSSTVTSSRRKLAVNLSIAAFAVGSAVSLITRRELWPFSPYPMFASLQTPELVVLDVVGLSASDSEEIPLAPSRRTSILTGSRYRTALDRLVEDGDNLQQPAVDEQPIDALRVTAPGANRSPIETRLIRLHDGQPRRIPFWPVHHLRRSGSIDQERGCKPLNARCRRLCSFFATP
jgi:hypothetical protein